MRVTIAVLALGASLVAASSAHVHPFHKLVARQDASGNSTRFAECGNECADFLGFETSCDAAADDGKDTDYECACRREVFDAARRCGTCVPEAFNDLGIEGGLEGFIQVGVDSCSALGFPVDMGTASSGASLASQTTSGATSSRATTAPATTRSPLSNTAAGVSSAVSSAVAAPTGAASQVQVASGLAAFGIAAGLLVLA